MQKTRILAERRQFYTLEPRLLPGGMQSAQHAVIKCGCGSEEAFVWRQTNFPPKIARRFGNLGWECEVDSTQAKCPACVARRVDSRKGESGKKETVMNAGAGVTTGAAAGVARDLTAAERFAVRGLLDKHFDDSNGVYLDNYSDQRIADEVSVPWKSVERVREAAYGKLKAVPELDVIRAELAKLEPKLLPAQRAADNASHKASEAKTKADDAAKLAAEAKETAEELKRQFGLVVERLNGALKRMGVAS